MGIDRAQKPSKRRNSFPTVSMLTSGLQHSHTYATSTNASQSCIIANEADRILVKTHTLVGIILSLMEVWWIPHDLCLYELAAFVCQKMLDRK